MILEVGLGGQSVGIVFLGDELSICLIMLFFTAAAAVAIKPLSLFYLFGAFQAGLLMVIVLGQTMLPRAQRLLIAALLLAMGIVLSYYVIILNKYASLYHYIDSLGSAAWMAIMPLFFLVTKSTASTQWRWRLRDAWLFLIPGVFVLEGVLTTLGFPVWLYQWVNDRQLFLDIWMLLFFGPGLYVAGWTSLYFWRSTLSTPLYNLRWFSYLFLAVLLVFGVTFIVIRQRYVVAFEFTLIVLLELLVFALVFQFFQAKGIKTLFTPLRKVAQTDTPAQLTTQAAALEQLMKTEQLYLNPDLNLQQLAEAAQISPHSLSRLFSQHYQTNFYDFINQYRLQHLENALQQPEAQQYKITALAAASGFKSKTTLYKVFKAKHQLTPAQFLKRQATATR